MANKILITGASSDIGKELISLIEQRIFNADMLLTYSKNMPIFSKYYKPYKVDFLNPIESNNFYEYLKKEEIDFFIQLQGGFSDAGDIENFSIEKFYNSLEINLVSSIKILQSILPKMCSKSYGRIVLMSTASANYGGGLSGFDYGMAKHGVLYLTKYLAKHYSKYNIITNCVSPGFINTKFHNNRIDADTDFVRNREKYIRLGRAGSPKQVASLIFNMAFDNDFVVGENIKIDGADFI